MGNDDKFVVVNYQKRGKKFEILVDPNKAFEFRKGKEIDIREVLKVQEIFRDSRKAERASPKDLEEIFGCSDVLEVAKIILKEGNFRLTTQQKRKLIEEKKIQIANIIAKRAINPQTGLPHPPQRILNAMEKAKVNIDPLIDAELQVDKVIKQISPILPLKIEITLLQIKIHPQFVGKAYNEIKRFPIDIIEENWLDDGSLVLKIKISSSIKNELIEKIAELTQGNFESKIIEKVKK